MAIKDWMIVLPNPNPDRYEVVYDNRKDGERMFISKNQTKITPNQKEWKYSYTVFIDGRKSRSFLTKSSALAYAKSYMRSH